LPRDEKATKMAKKTYNSSDKVLDIAIYSCYFCVAYFARNAPCDISAFHNLAVIDQGVLLYGENQ